jgi:hypothetical protein
MNRGLEAISYWVCPLWLCVPPPLAWRQYWPGVNTIPLWPDVNATPRLAGVNATAPVWVNTTPLCPRGVSGQG